MDEVGISIPPASLELIAQRVAELLHERDRDERPVSPYMSIEEAAQFLRCSRKRIYDLRTSGRLRRMNEGARALVLRAEVERLVLDEDALPASAPSRRVA
jgi:excisionase family DNA binding protein